MENYEQKYKELVGKIKKAYLYAQTDSTKAVLEDILPELKESEDEKTRKALIKFHKSTIDIDGVKGSDIIAWLEKQGEKPTDKVEPKFNFYVGQWIVATGKCVYCVAKIAGFNITLVDIDGNEYVFYVDSLHDAHIWTIADAKDGDVLVCIGKYGQEIGIIKEYIGKYAGCDKCFNTYCFVDWDSIFRTGEYMGSKEIHPATKEQRDLLFSIMKEAGYVWDNEKKVLKRADKEITEE